MKRVAPVSTLFTALIAVSLTGPCTAQSAGPEVEALETEVTALKEEVAQLRKELDEVLALAQIRALIEENRPMNISMSVEGAPAMGSDGAELTLIEFSDFQCPYCARHATQTAPELKNLFVDTGKVKYVFFDFPLGNHSLAPKAAEAARCAGEQDRFWEMHDVLFANQRQLEPERLPAHAGEAGVVDSAAFRECLDSGKYAASIEANMLEGAKLRVRGTPSFGLGYTEDGGRSVRVVKVIRGAQPLAQFQQSIEQLLAAEVPAEGSN